MLTQVDDEGYSCTLMEGLIDYKHDEMVVPMSDKFVYMHSGQ